jgi:predicted RNase H-like nuclease
VVKHTETVHFVGLDLAWGPVNRTGISVVNDQGGLDVLQTTIADDDIDTVVTSYLDDDLLV